MTATPATGGRVRSANGRFVSKAAASVDAPAPPTHTADDPVATVAAEVAGADAVGKKAKKAAKAELNKAAEKANKAAQAAKNAEKKATAKAAEKAKKAEKKVTAKPASPAKKSKKR